jgi:class 3 adenylate cyclase
VGAEASDGLLCILFTDVVGWTELGDRLGDDAADAIRREHFAAVRAALDAHRGKEIKTVGDSVLSTFRSALDAVRCAVAIQADAAFGPIRVRIGVHAGEPITEEGHVFGTAVNVASRLCAVAEPGEVVVSDLTRSLLGRRGNFSFESTGPLQLKGLREQMLAFRLRGDAPAAAVERPPTPAARTETSAPFRPVQPLLCPVVVGRDRELSRLTTLVTAAIDGAGGAVGLVGDAGVGKTRLCREMTDRANQLGAVVVAGRAVPGETPVPYRPLTEALLTAFRSGPPPDVPELAGFGGHLGRLVPHWRTDTTGGADESPVLLGEAVVRLLRVLGGEAGCVLILEDLHWADPETMAVVEYLTDALHEERVLAVCTSRPAGAATDVLARLQRREPMPLLGVAPLGGDDAERVAFRVTREVAPSHVLRRSVRP